jgi:hypothetical protein
MSIPNQGYRKDLNLQETNIDQDALDNLGGAGISQDLTIIQNNLRNISTVSYSGISTGFFYFGSNSSFVFTNDDMVTVSADVNLGSSSLTAGTNYYVCNSNAENQFKLSTTPSSVGFNTITITSVSPTNFYFIRNDAVDRDNIINFIKPNIQDTSFSYFGGGSINSAIDSSQSSNEVSKYLINKKYKTNQDTLATLNDFKYEGVVTVNDPVSLNVDQTGLDNAKSPGVFIGNTRAFSSDNNPWNQVGTALSTSSDQVFMGELFFSEDIYITGINAEVASSTQVTTFTHKLPVVINGETYYLLLKTS